jgi:putative endopeptidase
MTRFTTISLTLAVAFASGTATSQEVPTFGFPAGFSLQKMDTSADPRKDFTRYSAGKWFDALVIPDDSVRISGLYLMTKRTDVAVRQTVEEAAKKAPSAAKGSPTQQVGDLYAAGLDEARLKALGNAPLQPQFQRIDALTDKNGVAKELARLMLVTNDMLVMGGTITVGIRDKTKYIVAAGDGELILPNFEDYLKPEAANYRDAYLKFVAELLELAGIPQADAQAFAIKALAMETRIAATRQPLVEHLDPDKRFVEMSYAKLKETTPGFDWDTYYATIGIPMPTEVTAIEVNSMRERAAILSELSLEDTRMLLKLEYLRKSLGGLSSDFNQPGLKLTRAYYGDSFQLPPRSKVVFDTIAAKLGHPLGQLYVEKTFTPESKHAVEDMVSRVRAEFRARLEKNHWLTAATRKQALNKLDKVKITVGYPDQWIDYSSVDVRPGDYFGNLERINEFSSRRYLARFGGPIIEDEFNNPDATLPTVVNAAYGPLRNSIEIPAAFLQPPIYDPKGDPAINFCAIGAVIGHELTHGFDSGGRHYDEVGRARNWWVKADEVKFVAQAGKLVKQANAYQVLPGLHANGALGVTENLADVGGIAFAYGALEKYLKAHPEENKVIDGLTQEQRCFIAWGQFWSEKAREGLLRQVTATDAHAPGGYRAYSAAQHEPGFYKAFGIRKGDPMWLDPKDRVKIW